MVWEGGAAEEVRGARVCFLIDIGLALDATTDDEAELDGVGDECSEAEVGLLQCDYVCWFWGGVGDNSCFGLALTGAEGE